jgi:hypothetical protein
MRIALLVIVGLISACSKTPQDEFSAAWLKGQYNEQFSRKGGTYVRQMVGSLGPALTASEAECGVKPKEAPQPVDLVVQINLDGSVRKAMARPRSAAWDCIVHALAKKTFPPPPEEGFWTSGTIHN